MNILILNWRDPKHPLAGGAEQVMREHAKKWIEKGNTVTWFASSYTNAKPKDKIENITIIRQGSHYTVHLRAYFFLRNKKNNFDIIIDNFHFLPFFTPLYLPRNKIIAFINEPAKKAWFVNIMFPFSILGFLVEPLFFQFYKNISFITAASSIIQELNKYGIKESDIHLIHHGFVKNVTLEQAKREKKPTVVYLSQLSPDKGIEDAVRAVSMLVKKKLDLQFWIIGKAKDTDFEKKIKKQVVDMGIDSNTIFLGFVSEKEKFMRLGKAWVLIHPSIREGWGLNVIEAASVGTPSVGYNVTGLSDSIKNGITGLLTSDNTPENLAEKVEILLLDKKIHKKFSVNSLAWSKEFNWDKAGKESMTLIEKTYEKNHEFRS